MRVTNILLPEQHLIPDYAHPAHSPPHKHTHTHTHTHTNKKDTVCLMTSAHPTSSPHHLFPNAHHDEYTSFLITHLPKNKMKFYSVSLESWIQLYLNSTSPRNQYKLTVRTLEPWTPRVLSSGRIRIWICDPRSHRSRCMKGTKF